MHKKIIVPHLPYPAITDFNSFSAVFDTLPVYALTNQSWPEFKTSCKAEFSIFHTNDKIVLKFTIDNDYFKSIRRPVNGAVHKDNCVEFFISFSGKDYYNIEFNCLGDGKIAYGPKRTKRTFLPQTTIEKIQVLTRTAHTNKQFNWEMVLSIPLDVFVFDPDCSLKGLQSSGNFYKCGDDLPQPHYLSWCGIESAVPNFHLPQFFGDIIFE